MVRHFWANKPLWMLVSLACLRAGSLRQRGLGAEGPGQASSVALGQLAARPRRGSGGRRTWPHGLSALCLVSGPPEIHSCFRTTLPAQPPRPRATERDGEQTWGCQRKISGTGCYKFQLFHLAVRFHFISCGKNTCMRSAFLTFSVRYSVAD